LVTFYSAPPEKI